MSISRRDFLGRSGWLTAAALGLPSAAYPAPLHAVKPGQKPRHIIHLVTDGMSIGTLSCADQLSYLLRKRGLTWLKLYQQSGAVTGLMNMRSLNSLVTDSAAASSSWGSGSRVVNGALNVLPDGRDLIPLYRLFAEAGWGRGLVTTTEITHATPAGFASNVPDRDMAESIAEQYLDRKVEVLLGGGRKFFDPESRTDKRDIFAHYKDQGYAVFNTLEELNAAPVDKHWLGLFASSHLPYTIDHLADAKDSATVPSLAAMTHRALASLRRSPHFILQIEGGRVDHACHNCDAATALQDQIAFDEALDVCLHFQQQEPDTLLVITTDHGNGNPGLTGSGGGDGKKSPLLANVTHVKGSFPKISSQLGKSPQPKEIRQVISEFTGYDAPDEKVDMLAKYLEKKGQTLYDQMNSASVQLGQLLANHLGIGWVSSSHTSDYVTVTAAGPGAERFAGFVQNTDIFKHYLALAGINYRNPTVPLLAECPPTAAEVETSWA